MNGLLKPIQYLFGHFAASVDNQFSLCVPCPLFEERYFFADSNINELDQGCHSLLYSNHCLLFTLQVYAKIPDTFSAEKIMPVSHNTEFEVEFEIFSLLLD